MIPQHHSLLLIILSFGVPYNPIQGQDKGLKMLEIRNSSIVKVFLLCHLKTDLVKYLNLFVPGVLHLSQSVFAPHDFELYWSRNVL